MSSWDDKFAEFLERVMATAVAGGDPKPLQAELKRLMEEKDGKDGTKSGPVPTDDRGQARTRASGVTSGGIEQQLDQRRRPRRRSGKG